MKYLSPLLLSILLQKTIAQDISSTLNQKFDAYENEDLFNGIILIAQEGEVVFSRSFGYADFENKIELDLNTPMHLASNTKAFTNMGIMILSERGLLQYDDLVTKYIPKFPYQEVTIRHLMTMTSGLKRLYNKDLDKDGFITNEELIEFLATKKPKLSFQPGEKMQSSVVSACMLAEVIATVSKKDYPQFMQEEIFNPLEMTNTFIVTSDNLDRFRAISYNSKNRLEEWWLGSYIGGVSIYASATDILKWGQALYSEKLVSKETIAAGYLPHQLNDGSKSRVSLGGWMRWKGQDQLIFKNGDWVANNSILWRDIEKKVTVIVLNNRQNKVTKFDIMDVVLTVLGYQF